MHGLFCNSELYYQHLKQKEITQCDTFFQQLLTYPHFSTLQPQNKYRNSNMNLYQDINSLCRRDFLTLTKERVTGNIIFSSDPTLSGKKVAVNIYQEKILPRKTVFSDSFLCSISNISSSVLVIALHQTSSLASALFFLS